MSSNDSSAGEKIATTRLGSQGPEVGVQGLGCMGMSWAYGPTQDPDEARATLERALELGVTLYDTANVYGETEGDNERFIAPFVQRHREEIVLATKFSLAVDAASGTRTINNDPAYLKKCAEDSLRRLGIETIDLYYMHRRDPAVPLEESVGAMAELVQEGKVRHLGLSEITAEELRTAHEVHPIAAVQSEWSLFSRDAEHGGVVDTCRELGAAFVPYSPLGRGFLTGSFTDAAQELGDGDMRRVHPRFTGDNARSNAALLEPVRRIAAEHGATPGQIALAWVQQQAQLRGQSVIPIPGTRRRSRVEENTAATRITLGEAELAALEPIAEQVAGARYPAGFGATGFSSRK